jgi:hypothetical protein
MKECFHAAGDDVTRRLVATDEKKERFVDKGAVVDAVAFDLTVDESAEEVVRRSIRPTSVDLVADIDIPFSEG